MGRKRTLLGIGTLHFFSNLLITSNQLDLNHITYLGASSLESEGFILGHYLLELRPASVAKRKLCPDGLFQDPCRGSQLHLW